MTQSISRSPLASCPDGSTASTVFPPGLQEEDDVISGDPSDQRCSLAAWQAIQFSGEGLALVGAERATSSAFHYGSRNEPSSNAKTNFAR